MIVFLCLPFARAAAPLPALPHSIRISELRPVAARACLHGESALSRSMEIKPLWPREGSEILAARGLRTRCG